MDVRHVDARGVLHPHEGGRRFHLGRVTPSPEVATVIAYHWSVRWDAGQVPHTQDVLSHPNVHVVTELHESDGRGDGPVAQVHGVVRGTFRRELVGRGRVHGVKFRAGTFRPLLGTDVATITGQVVPAGDVLGPGWTAVAAEAIAADDDETAARTLEAAILDRLPHPDLVGCEIADLVERVEADRSLTRADQVAELAGVTVRTLQRSFARYVGVGPKWVVRRFRLHEAAARLASGQPIDLATLAAELGYSDQAHLTNDFRAAVGAGPASYARQQRDGTPVGDP